MLELKEIKKALENIEEVKAIEEKAKNHRYHIYIKPLRKDKEFLIELKLTYTDKKDKKSLPYTWYKNKLTDQIINDYINISTYCTNQKNKLNSYYNPQIKTGKDNRNVIDFDYLYKADENSIKKIILDTIDNYKNDIK